MIQNKTYNYSVIFIFSILLVTNIVTEVISKCIDITSAGMGVLLGWLLGTGFYYAIEKGADKKSQGIEYSNYLKINSNSEMCSKPGKKNYKCKVHNRRKDPHAFQDPQNDVPHIHSHTHPPDTSSGGSTQTSQGTVVTSVPPSGTSGGGYSGGVHAGGGTGPMGGGYGRPGGP